MQYFLHQMEIAWHTYSLFWEMWQHHKSAKKIYCWYCYILTSPSETRWKKVTSPANFFCSLRYCVTPGSSFWATQRQIFIVPHQPISHLVQKYLVGMVIPIIHLGYGDTLPLFWYYFPLEIIVFGRILLAYKFDTLCTGYCSLSVVGMAIFHV